MPKIIILRGVSGVGKSTWAREHGGGLLVPVCSADHYFIDSDGTYRFDPEKLASAHAHCLRIYVEAVKHGSGAVVDNTNTTVAEVAPYYAIAEAYGAEVEIVTLMMSPEEAHRRSVHGVSLDDIKAQHASLVSAVFPPWWKHRIIGGDDAPR